ncbi:MAG: Biopolymer transport protein ExbD [Lentisphaerae bacterium ADurb.BinA184]|nr:MAG: Biopolymer transport protein ExbD [Lentisphaerae bacterium ADurb.BinA184]
MKQRNEEQLETPITPMIDIVFQLIIFFVVTAAAQNELIDENIKLAQAKYATAQEKQDPNTVYINVRSNGEMNVAKLPITERQLRNLLITTRRAAGDKAPIVIRCDGNAPYEHVAKVHDICKEAGFGTIRLAAFGATKKK